MGEEKITNVEERVFVNAPTTDRDIIDFPEFDYPVTEDMSRRTSMEVTEPNVTEPQAECGTDEQQQQLKFNEEANMHMPRAPVSEEESELADHVVEEVDLEQPSSGNQQVSEEESHQVEVRKHVVAIESKLSSKFLESRAALRSRERFQKPTFDLNLYDTEKLQDNRGFETKHTPTRRSSLTTRTTTKSHSEAPTPEQTKPAPLKRASLPMVTPPGGRSRSRREESVPSRKVTNSTQPLGNHNRQTVSRSISPVPNHWQDHAYGAGNNNVDPMAKSPRYITPTIAASLKTVKAPAGTQAASKTAVSNPPPPAANPMKTMKTLEKDAPLRKTAISKVTPVKHQTAGNKDLKTTSKVPPSKPEQKASTEAAGFNFRCSDRAEKRREYYTKLEERVKAKEAEKKQLEAKHLEEKESQLRELRRSLTYKANPVPSFYQEPAPAPPEIKKTPPTRPKSPKFTPSRRRDSVSPAASEGSNNPPKTRTLPRRASLELDTKKAEHVKKVRQPLEQPLRRLSSVKKSNTNVQKGDSGPLRNSVSTNGRVVHNSRESKVKPVVDQVVKVSPAVTVKASPRADGDAPTAEDIDEFLAMQREVEGEQDGEFGKLHDDEFSPNSQGNNDRGKVWSPEELARIYSRKNSPANNNNYASVKDIVLEFSRRLGTPAAT